MDFHLPLQLGVVAIEKGAFGSPSNKVDKNVCLHIYKIVRVKISVTLFA